MLLLRGLFGCYTCGFGFSIEDLGGYFFIYTGLLYDGLSLFA